MHLNGLFILLLMNVCSAVLPKDEDPLFYPTLRNYHRNAKSTSSFKWLVEVIISKNGIENHVCSAVCYKHRLFITTVRCVAGLSPDYMVIRRDKLSARVLVYILPAQLTKQSYDDLAIIITEETDTKWDTVNLYNHSTVDWQKDKNFTNNNIYTAVGFAIPEDDFWLQADTAYQLKTLQVRVGDVCKKLYRPFRSFEYERPCYHTCTSQEVQKKDPKCNSYLGAEGTALYDVNSSSVMGIASWGLSVWNETYPVGLALFDNAVFWQNLLVCSLHLLTRKMSKISHWIIHPDLCLDGCDYKYLQWLPRQIAL